MKAQHPFTVAWVREAIESLGGGYRAPSESELESMVSWLNGFAFIYTWEDRPKVRHSEVRNALKVLACYHEDRWKELLATAPHLPPHFVEREMQLRDKFNAYSEEMIRLRALRLAYLPMDVAALYAPLKSWHDIAESIAGVFARAMKESNPGKPFGNWERGPVVRFTTAALNLIGILPPADQLEELYPRVAKHLRAIKAEDRKKNRAALARGQSQKTK